MAVKMQKPIQRTCSQVLCECNSEVSEIVGVSNTSVEIAPGTRMIGLWAYINIAPKTVDQPTPSNIT